MKLVTTIADLDEARGAERFFVFLFINWSGPAHVSRGSVVRLVECWQREVPDPPVPCYLIDLSEQAGPIGDAVENWLTASERPAGPLMVNGAVPLLWVYRGAMVAHVPGSLHKSVEMLVAVTRATFGSDAATGDSCPGDGIQPARNTPIWPDDEFTRHWLEGIAEARRRAD